MHTTKLDFRYGTEQQATVASRFERLCREAGLRLTPQRLAVYEALVASDAHPSAEGVCRVVRQRYPNISLDTVNRTLGTLVRIGAAFVVEGTGEPKRFDGRLSDHVHFRCIRCRRVVDCDDEMVAHPPAPKGLNQAFSILRSTVYYEGVCDRCMETPQTHSVR